MSNKTVIMGSGIAGMSCAVRIQKARQDFLLITEDQGRLIKYARDARVDFGAYFVMAN